MIEIDIQIREVFVPDERDLSNVADHRISMSHGLEREGILLRSSNNLTITRSNKSAIPLVNRHFHIDTLHDFHRRPIGPAVGVSMRLNCDKILGLWIVTDDPTNSQRTKN